MKKLLVLVVILSSITFSGCQVEIPFEVFKTDPTPTPRATSKHVVTSTLPFTEKWTWSGMIGTSSWYPPAITIADERVVIAGYDGYGRKVMVFDVHTGNLLWESDHIRNLSSIHTQRNRVFVGSIRYVQAFDLESGELLWTGAEQPIDKKGSLNVYSTDEQLEVYDFGQNLLYRLNFQTGQTIDKMNYPFIFFKKGKIYYSGCGYGFKTSCLMATNEVDGKTLWAHNFGGFVYLWPTFIHDSMMFINAGGQLLAIAPKTGSIIWQSEKDRFVTGISVQNNLAYALRRDAAIVALDPKTGEEIGIIEMTPNRTVEDDAGYVTHYAIATSEKFMAVYYGSSQQLIVFERSDDVGSTP